MCDKFFAVGPQIYLPTNSRFGSIRYLIAMTSRSSGSTEGAAEHLTREGAAAWRKNTQEEDWFEQDVCAQIQSKPMQDACIGLMQATHSCLKTTHLPFNPGGAEHRTWTGRIPSVSALMHRALRTYQSLLLASTASESEETVQQVQMDLRFTCKAIQNKFATEPQHVQDQVNSIIETLLSEKQKEFSWQRLKEQAHVMEQFADDQKASAADAVSRSMTSLKQLAERRTGMSSARVQPY